jgi:UDP-N-acetylmuramoyl-tripeptide--D-alanyl-D-alanine ligase
MTSQLIWQAEEVVRAVHGRCLHEQTWAARSVAIDSRREEADDFLFIALKGPVHDGHDYVAGAFAAGAAAAIVSRQPSQAPPDAPLIFVEDTFKALEALGHAGRKRAEGKIIAVTGSVGKTSTKEMLRLALSSTGETYANEGNLNNHLGVPLSLARLPATAHYGVFELGMNHAGELGPLSRQVSPHVALITNIEAAHLEFFDSLDAIADAKAEVFFGMKPQGAAVLNRDNRHYARLAAAAKAHGVKNVFGFGRDSKAEARLIELAAAPESSAITADILGRRLFFTLGAPGEHLAINALAALLAAAAAGSDIEACAEALARYRPPKGRGVIETLAWPGGEITLIDESYNASPVAVRFAARVLGQMMPTSGGRRILVLGDMRELGEAAPALHAALTSDIAAAKIDLVFCCGEMTAHLFDALPEAMRGARGASSAELAPLVAAALRAGDIVTVKGSNSMSMATVVGALRSMSSDQPHQKLAG